MTDKLLSGIVPPLVTPFKPDRSLRLDLAEALVWQMLADGAGGVYLLGSTGEGGDVAPAERKRWAEAVIGVVAGQVPVVVHVGATATTADAAELAQHAGACKASGVASVPPIDRPTDLQATIDHYQAIARSVDLPFYVYWQQAFLDRATGQPVTPAEFLAHMETVPNFAGIKFTDYKLTFIERIKRYRPDLNLLTGREDIALGALAMGLDGAIGATFNVTLRLMNRMVGALHKGDLDAARQDQSLHNDLYEFINGPQVGWLRGIKKLMEMRGLAVGLPRAAESALTDRDVLDQLAALGHKALYL